MVHQLIAVDQDIMSQEDLKFDFGLEPMTAVDKNGKQVCSWTQRVVALCFLPSFTLFL